MTDPSTYRSSGGNAHASPQPALMPTDILGPSSPSSLPLHLASSSEWSRVDMSPQHSQQLRLQQQIQQQLYQHDASRSHTSPHHETQSQRVNLAQQQALEYDTLALQGGLARSTMTPHMSLQDWYGASKLESQRDGYQDHVEQLALGMEQRLSLGYDERSLPELNGSQHQQRDASNPNRPTAQQHIPLRAHGFHSTQGFAKVQPPPGFHASPTVQLSGSDAAARLPNFDHRMAPSSNLEPNFNLQERVATPNVSSNAAVSLGPPPGLGGGPILNLDAGSHSVSQQLDVYQERLQAQLQAQQRLWQQQHYLQQLYILQQQHQIHFASNPNVLDQHAHPPFMMMRPPNQSGSETHHFPRSVYLQGGMSRPTMAQEGGISPMLPPPTLDIKEQQDQAQQVQRHLSELLFESYNNTNHQGGASHALEMTGVLPRDHLPLENIEAAQLTALQHQQQQSRKSLSDLVLPPEESLTSPPPLEPIARPNRLKMSGDTVPTDPSLSTATSDSAAPSSGGRGGGGRRYSHIADHQRRKGSITQESSFSIKDTNLFSVPKYDPYRPSQAVFDGIAMEVKDLCNGLLPNPAEETRKLGLLDRLHELANEVFEKADVLPFGSSGNGLALANADMDLCVFLPRASKKKDGSGCSQHHHNETELDLEDQHGAVGAAEAEKAVEEVSPAEFVERMGNRLEKDPEFCDILQLRKARVPIVKLVHSPTGIACDIGYENHLALWNTRLLRAYSRIDGRLRELVTVVKYWAKRRKINNPYVGTLSSYAYVLLVIHVLQVRGILPNLQTITADNSGRVPFWDCQGFNRYFFEDVAELENHWRPSEGSQHEGIGELLYEFFRYFVNEFRYATHVISIRKGGLLTKEQKEWSKEFLQAENRPQTGIRSRYLFCIEDPFEVDHNVARTVDRFTLFTIRGEFMRATKVLSRGGENIIGRLCQEKEDPLNSNSASHEDMGVTTGEGDGTVDQNDSRHRRPSDDHSTQTSAKLPWSPDTFPEGNEPIRTSNTSSNTSSSDFITAGRGSHHGGGARASLTLREGQHLPHRQQGRLSHQQHTRQQHHNSSQSKRTSHVGGSYGSNPRDRSRQ